MRTYFVLISLVVVLSLFVSSGFSASPVLEVSPLELNFTAYEGGTNPTSQVLSIWKGSGNGPLNWEVSEECDWLVVDPNNGTSTEEVDNVDVIVDITGLVAGTYNCQITVSADGADNSPQLVDVELVVIGPIIEVDPKSFEFLASEGGSNPKEQVLSISNTGGGTLQWEINEDCEWLIVEPDSGSCSMGEVNEVNIIVDISGLSEDVYTCNLMIIDSHTENSPQVLIVNLHIYPFDTLLVPNEYPTIQAAIDDCNNGDTVIVADGTYTGEGNYNINFQGKAITLQSANGPMNCIIDCQNGLQRRGFNFTNGEGRDSILNGVTIKRGYVGWHDGGGIYISNSSPSIKNCIIDDNYAGSGGGIYCQGSNALIENCLITHNSADDGLERPKGGGIYAYMGCRLEIRNCTIAKNTASVSEEGWGGGIRFEFCNNTNRITNCIFWGNTAYAASQISMTTADNVQVTYCDIQGGYAREGNISTDPCFFDYVNNNYHILHNSPCINSGDPGYVADPCEKDIDGQPRIIFCRVDMGFDEYYSTQPFIELSPVELDFEAIIWDQDPNFHTMTIRNLGNESLHWNATIEANWLSIDVNSGTCPEFYDSNIVTVDVNIDGLTAGTYVANIVVSDPCAFNTPQIVRVNLNIIGPLIETSKTQFEFYAFEGGENPNDQILGIFNSGGGTLNWQISEDCSWLSVNPNIGSSTGEVDNVNLSVDISGLAKSIYLCNLTVWDINADNSPQTVGVTLSVDAEGILLVPTEYGTIQAGIDAAQPGDTVIVAEGAYTGAGNKDLDFGGKAITVQSTDPEDPAVVAATVIDCENSGRGFYFHSGEEADSVLAGFTIKRGKVTGRPAKGGGIYCSGASPTIKNCVINSNLALGSGGNPHGGSACGGGVYCESNSYLTLIDSTVSSNRAIGGRGDDLWCSPMSGCYGGLGSGGNGYGGGIYGSSDSGLIIVDCIITDNSTSGGNGGIYYDTASPIEGASGGWAWGGGVYCGSAATVIKNCSIIGNIATGGDGGQVDDPYGFDGERGMVFGGGVCGKITISNSIISSNYILPGIGELMVPKSGGGGICCTASSSIVNCLISDNSATLASFSTGIHFLFDDNHSIIKGCTISNNTSDYYPPAYAVDEADNLYTVSATIADSIIWGHGGRDVGFGSVTYSCTEQSVSGTGNIGDNPLFVTGSLGNYYLSQIAAGQAVDSPCVDAGSDTAANLGMDLFTTRTDHFVDAGSVDMGYHYAVTTHEPEPADIDGNGYVNFVDYSYSAADWLSCNDANLLPGDINNDKCVDINDIKALTARWLDCCVTDAIYPQPTNNAACVIPDVTLSWSPGWGVLYHDVYFGTDAYTVATAGHGSPEFMGTVSETFFDLYRLEPAKTYYWRIDEVGPMCLEQGEIWSFKTYEPLCRYEPFGNLNVAGRWKFDEGTGSIAYDSAGNNDGTIYGATWTSGKFNGALSFDGLGDYVDCGNDASLDPDSGSFAVSAWIKTNVANDSKMIVCNSSYTDFRTVWFSTDKYSHVYVFIIDNSLNTAYVSGTSNIEEGNWHYIVAVRDENNLYLYVDGVCEGTPADVTGLGDVIGPGSWTIGALKYPDSAASNCFNGLIDEVAIYK